jgi:hypothetical protein
MMILTPAGITQSLYWILAEGRLRPSREDVPDESLLLLVCRFIMTSQTYLNPSLITAV